MPVRVLAGNTGLDSFHIDLALWPIYNDRNHPHLPECVCKIKFPMAYIQWYGNVILVIPFLGDLDA